MEASTPKPSKSRTYSKLKLCPDQDGTNNFNVYSIFEESRGITDLQVLKKSVDLNALLITEDIDFGEWIFSFHTTNNGVIFLRYRFDQLEELTKKLILVLDKHNQELYNKFIVITPKRLE